MRTTTLTLALTALLPTALTHPFKVAPLRTRSISYIPPDLYASPDPSFAGAPIVLSSPPPPPTSLTPGPGRYAITYTPYTADGLCKTYDVVTADISRVAAAGFAAVRLYATDCHSVRSVGLAALANGLNLILGVHVADQGVTHAAVAEQVAQIAAFVAEAPEHRAAVDLVVVGNEALFNDFATPAELVGLIGEVRKALRTEGYEGPVSTAEPFGTFVENARALCPAVDVVVANLLPFFHQDVPARLAGEFVADQMADLEGICEAGAGGVEGVSAGFASRGGAVVAVDREVDSRKGAGEEEEGAEDRYSSARLTKRESRAKPVLAMEVGWPSQGSSNGDATPGRAEQRAAMAAMAEAIGSRTVFTSFADDEWREPGDFGVERHWGCIEVFE